jgi:predicted amidophosphoribosyltransferase
MRAALQRIADSLLAVTLAPQCAACGAVLDAPTRGAVCAACWSSVRPVPRFIGDAASESVSCWRAAGEYEGTLRTIIHAFKYDERRSLARPLGRLMLDAGAEMLDGAACAVPVPLHPWRRFRRGFNQSADLAARLGLPVVHALWRTRATVPQSGLDAEARRRNVRQAFRLSPLLSGPPAALTPRAVAPGGGGQRPRARHALVFDRIVVLVDDVRTTGATLDTCAAILRRAGAREVRALVAGSVLAQTR